MDKQGSRNVFEEWLRAYCDHLHLVRQGQRLDLVRPEAAKPPVSAKNNDSISMPARKP